MRVVLRRAVRSAIIFGLLALAPSASASTSATCGSVGVTIPHTNNHGHAALNNITAINVTCVTARSVAKTFLLTAKAPERWHASTKTVVTHSHGQSNTVGEEILTRAAARVVGEIAN